MPPDGSQLETDGSFRLQSSSVVFQFPTQTDDVRNAATSSVTFRIRKEKRDRPQRDCAAALEAERSVFLPSIGKSSGFYLTWGNWLLVWSLSDQFSWLMIFYWLKNRHCRMLKSGFLQLTGSSSVCVPFTYVNNGWKHLSSGFLISRLLARPSAGV